MKFPINKTQLESSENIKKLVAGIEKPITMEKLIELRDLMYSKLEILPYNETTVEQEKSIRWKRTAAQIFEDGFVFSGKACTDLVVSFLALCQTFELETRFVKVKNEKMVHSVAEIKLNDGWYIFDVSTKTGIPIKGEITKENPYKNWQLWKKGRDAWDLGLNNFEAINKVR